MNRFQTRRWTKKELVAYRLGQIPLTGKYKAPKQPKIARSSFRLKSGNREEV